MRNRLTPHAGLPNNQGFPDIRRLGIDDLKICAALSLDRGWWPERGKWALLLAESEAYGIDAPDGDGLAGSAVLTRWGTDRAAIGMVLVARRFGRMGFGRALMEHALCAAGEDTAVSLFATDMGRPLYEKLGFQPVRQSVAFRGHFRPDSQVNRGKKNKEAQGGTPGHVRAATEADLPTILTLDRAAYGADRERILSRMPDFADRFLVFENDEGIVGFGAAWRTELFLVIGPLVAPDSLAARCLVTELSADSPVAIRLDLDPDRPELPGWVHSCGLRATEQTVYMTRGDLTPRGMPELVYTPISVAMA